ncbi:MAG: UvrD-helicase domain-containing protein [Phycisphaerales bacterium]|nr:UvrD-helicase domain-containing protein [Phycisphaerales bacterium]
MTYDPHRVVLASAGTGKTFQLTNRYIGLLAEHCDPSSILATTFTRKAAGEILSRILDRLADAAVGGPSLDELRAHVDATLTAARCAELTSLVARNLHRLSILTIDAFFLRIADCFSLELGIPPGWRICESDTDALLRSQAIEQALARSNRVELLAFVQMLHKGDLGRSVHTEIERVVGSTYTAYLQSEPTPGAWNVFGPTTALLDTRALDEALRALRPAEMPTTKAGKPNTTAVKAHDKACAAVVEHDWDAFLSKGIASKIIQGEHAFSRAPIPPKTIAAYQPLIDHAAAVLLTRLKDRNRATHELMARFDAAYQERKASAGAYQFDDIPRRLTAGSVAAELDDMYYRLDARLDHVLLDEFQDTSVVQFRLLEPILDELLADGSGERSVFCVGDVKQSLYVWREAEPELLPNLQARWPQLAPIELSKNYRSSPVITDTVNAVFTDLARNPALDDVASAAEVWSDRFSEHTAAHTQRAGAARLIVGPTVGERPKAEERRRVLISYAAERVAQIVDEAPQARIAVLLRRNRHVADLIHELKLLDIPASEEGGNLLTDAPPVAVAMSLLHMADHPGDAAARFHIATSPMGEAIGLTDPMDHRHARIVAADLRRKLMRDGYASVLGRLAKRCAASMDARGFGRFEQLLDLAQEFETQAGTRPTDFVRYVQARAVEEPGRENVRVMTIHRAKGLEFDAVILPELDVNWSVDSAGVMTDRPDPFHPVATATCYAGKELRALHSGLDRLHDRCLHREVIEALCGLYVAMTRAIHLLEMIVPPGDWPPKGRNAASVLRGALAPEEHAEPETVLWCDERGDWAADLSERAEEVGPPGADFAALKVELTLAPPSESPTSRLSRSSPSAMEGGGGINLDELLTIGSNESLQLGTLVHRWFERIEWLDEGPPSRESLLADARELAWGLGWDDATAAQHADAFLESLRTGAIADALARTRYADRMDGAIELEVRREWPFAMRDVDEDAGRAALLTGRIDRLVIAHRAGRAVWAEILDYKTDRITPGDAQARIEYYRPQIRAYRRAAAHLLGLSRDAVSACLVFTAADHVEPIT